MNKTLFSFAALLFVALTVRAENRMTVGGVQYATTGDTTATAYLTVKAIDDVTIEETIKIKGKTYRTTEIGKAYFGKNEYLQGIDIPNSVRLIRKGAFKGCSNLSKVTLPDTLCQIEKGAFEGCMDIAYVRTHHPNRYAPDYALAVMPNSIPYYKIKDDLASMNITDDDLKELVGDIEVNVDDSIPRTKVRNKNTFAFIIGNEEYEEVQGVAYASKDASVFSRYCELTMGIPADNIHTYKNATFGRILRVVRDIKGIAEAYKDKCTIIFYYAGHGIPDEKSHDAFLLPTDADGKSVEGCYSLARLYRELGDLPAKNVLVFLDACFSGALRGDGMLTAARGVAIKSKAEVPKGNMVVFSAATGDETAYPYDEKGHGMFTYYLLNKLNTSRGNCTLGDLEEYVRTKVTQKSNVVNRKSQTPTVACSGTLQNEWKGLKLK